VSLVIPTPAGDFRDRVRIVRRNANNTNELGETVPVDDVLATVPAKVVPLKSAEILANAENTLSVTHEVRLRYTTLVDHASTLIFRGRRLDVSDVTDVGEQRRELAITCIERKP
jgi:SPP1 family predicted phage head-tail adaptor